jgi:hypothetical protein
MSQSEINSAVAAATGENIRLIEHIGFGLADPWEADYDPEPRRPLVFDWDAANAVEWLD